MVENFFFRSVEVVALQEGGLHREEVRPRARAERGRRVRGERRNMEEGGGGGRAGGGGGRGREGEGGGRSFVVYFFFSWVIEACSSAMRNEKEGGEEGRQENETFFGVNARGC